MVLFDLYLSKLVNINMNVPTISIELPIFEIILFFKNILTDNNIMLIKHKIKLIQNIICENANISLKIDTLLSNTIVSPENKKLNKEVVSFHTTLPPLISEELDVYLIIFVNINKRQSIDPHKPIIFFIITNFLALKSFMNTTQ